MSANSTISAYKEKIIFSNSIILFYNNKTFSVKTAKIIFSIEKIPDVSKTNHAKFDKSSIKIDLNLLYFITKSVEII